METISTASLQPRELAERYRRALADEMNLISTIEGDHDVVFRHPDLGTLFFYIDAEHDPEYLMLIFPNFANAQELNLNREKLLLVLNTVNNKNKAVKMTIRLDTIDSTCEVVASIECFIAKRDHAPTEDILRATIKRNISALRGGVQTLVVEAKNVSDSSTATLTIASGDAR